MQQPQGLRVPTFSTISLVLGLLFSQNDAKGQVVRYVQNAYRAEYYVFETKDSASASYYVYQAKNPAEALKDGIWYIAEEPFAFRGKAILLHRVKSPLSADIVVYYVKNPKNAGSARTKRVR